MHISRLYLFFYDDISWSGKHRCPRLWIKCSRIYFGRYDRQEDSKRQWQFRIRWRGYDEDENIWYSRYSKSGRSVANLSTQGRSSAIYPIISSDIIGQITENKTDCSGTAQHNRNRRFNRVWSEIRQRHSDSRHKAFFYFFLGQNNLFI